MSYTFDRPDEDVLSIVRNTGGFHGWVNPKRKIISLNARMRHIDAVRDDVSFYDMEDGDVGERFGISRREIDDLIYAEEIYDLMGRYGWVRFYQEYRNEKAIVIDTRAGTDEDYVNFAKFLGFKVRRIGDTTPLSELTI